MKLISENVDLRRQTLLLIFNAIKSVQISNFKSVQIQTLVQKHRITFKIISFTITMMPLSDQTNTIIRQDLELCLNFVEEYFKDDFDTCRKITFFLKNETKFPSTQVSQILGNTPVRNYLYSIIKNGLCSPIYLPGTGEMISMQQVLEEHNIGEYLKNIASKVNPDWLIPVQTSGLPITSGKLIPELDTRNHEDIDMDCDIGISTCRKRSFPNDSYFQMPCAKVRRC